MKIKPLSFLAACFYWKFMKTWFLLKKCIAVNPKIDWVKKLCFNFAFCFCYTWNYLVEIYIFLVLFCCWRNSFMKGDEGCNISKATDRNRLFLLKIKIKQKSACQNNEYNGPSNTFIRISGPIPEVKKICIDQSLGKCCILGRMRKILISAGSREATKVLQFSPLLNLEIVFPVLKLTRSCYLKLNISFSWKLSI